MAYCFKCGTELIPGAEFCYSCGTRVPAVVFQGTEPAPEKQPQNQQRQEEKENRQNASAAAGQKPADEEPAVLKEEVTVPQIMIDEMITVDQISRGDTIIIRDPKLASPIRIRLRPGLKDGSMLKVKEARVRISGGEAIIPVVIHLHVKNPLNHPLPSAMHIYEQPSPAQNDSYLRAQRPDSVSPAKDPAAEFSSSSVISCRVVFELGMPEDIGRFKLGGAEDDGTLEIYDEFIVLYRISKVLTQGLGLAGHLIAGKGKELEQIGRDDVIRAEKELNKKGEVMNYYLTLTGGRVLKLRLLGLDNAAAHQAMDRFLGE